MKKSNRKSQALKSHQLQYDQYRLSQKQHKSIHDSARIPLYLDVSIDSIIFNQQLVAKACSLLNEEGGQLFIPQFNLTLLNQQQTLQKYNQISQKWTKQIQNCIFPKSFSLNVRYDKGKPSNKFMDKNQIGMRIHVCPDSKKLVFFCKLNRNKNQQYTFVWRGADNKISAISESRYFYHIITETFYRNQQRLHDLPSRTLCCRADLSHAGQHEGGNSLKESDNIHYTLINLRNDDNKSCDDLIHATLISLGLLNWRLESVNRRSFKEVYFLTHYCSFEFIKDAIYKLFWHSEKVAVRALLIVTKYLKIQNLREEVIINLDQAFRQKFGKNEDSMKVMKSLDEDRCSYYLRFRNEVQSIFMYIHLQDLCIRSAFCKQEFYLQMQRSGKIVQLSVMKCKKQSGDM